MNFYFASLVTVPSQLCLPFPTNRAYHCTSAGIDQSTALWATVGRTNARKNLPQILRSMLNKCAVVCLNDGIKFLFYLLEKKKIQELDAILISSITYPFASVNDLCMGYSLQSLRTGRIPLQK